jgi:glycosyltransferase involved in cell wall biosynthesis
MNISIVMATHNGRVHLEKQLQSLLAQTYLPQEIVISDDGSTDGTREMLSQYAGVHRHIHVLYAERQGINNNFQNSVSACKGEYIAFCDQDDIWEKDKLVHLAAAFSTNTLLAYGKSVLIDAEDHQSPDSAKEHLGFNNYRKGHLPYYFYFSNCISGHAMMVKRSLVETALPFPNECLYDQWLALIASAKSEIIHVPKAITFHRIHELNTTNNPQRNREQKRKRKKPLKYEKFSKQRKKHLLLLQKGLMEGDTFDQSERNYLSEICRQITRLDKQFFNIKLFFLLYQYRHQLFHGNLLRECRNRSLGGRYFRFLDSLKLKKAG